MKQSRLTGTGPATHKYAQKVQNSDGSQSQTGVLYNDTKTLATNSLVLFVERDIFLAIRREKLPRIGFTIRVEGTEENQRIRLTVRKVEGLIINPFFFRSRNNLLEKGTLSQKYIRSNQAQFYSDLGHRIVNQLTLILWKYNRELLVTQNGESKLKERRFRPVVEFPIPFLKKQISESLHRKDELILAMEA